MMDVCCSASALSRVLLFHIRNVFSFISVAATVAAHAMPCHPAKFSSFHAQRCWLPIEEY